MHTANALVSNRAAKARKREPALLSLGLFAAVLFSPSLLDAVLLANLGVLVAVALLQLAVASLSRARVETGITRPPRRWAREPFVSVHVPVAGATPEKVARTLDALRRLEWSAFEVVVVTPEPLRRARLERLSARLGPRFRFLHAPRALIADRAAALHLSLDESDPRTELVLVVDPGVRVHSKLLLHAARYFDVRGVSHVALAATTSADEARALVDERASRASALLPFAEAAGVPLPSGTPLLVQRRALAAIGGWSGLARGEEAALAVHFAARGLEGRCAREVSARSASPMTLTAAREERRRGVFDHARTLFHLEGRTWRALGLRRSLAVAAQLTSRFDFLLLPALALPVLLFLPNATREHSYALFAATLAFPLHALGLTLVHVVAPRGREAGGGLLRCLLARFSFAWEGSTAWLQALFGVRLAPPENDRGPPSLSLLSAAMPLLAAATLAITGGGFLYRGQVGAALACALASSIFGAVLYVGWELSQATRKRHGRLGESRQEPAHGPRPRWSRRVEGKAASARWDRVA